MKISKKQIKKIAQSPILSRDLKLKLFKLMLKELKKDDHIKF